MERQPVDEVATAGPGGRRPARVVVGVDASTGSRSALVQALTAAAARDAELDVVTAVSAGAYWTDLYYYDAGMLDRVRQETADDVAGLLREVREDPAVRAVEGATEVPVRTVASFGAAADVLLGAAAGADLLVVGSRGRGAVRSALLGSVALHCVTHAACPVVVARPVADDAARPPRVVVGVDGSEPSGWALREAVAEAGHRGAVVEAVAAYESADRWTDMHSVLAPSPAQVRADVERAAGAFVRGTLRAPAGEMTRPDVVLRVVEGPARDVLLERARGAQLLVVGARGRGALRGLLLGSVALHSAVHAPCPVMVVHPRAGRWAGQPERTARAERTEPVVAGR